MTYWQFHFVFLLPILTLMILSTWYQIRVERTGSEALKFVALMAVVAFIYTTPWDNFLVKNEVWGYGADRVSAVIGYVPIEEYAFFILQPIVVGLALVRYSITKHKGLAGFDRSPAICWTGFAVFMVCAVVFYFLRAEDLTYLRLIIVWSFPIIAIQWLAGGDYLVADWRRWCAIVVPFTLYFAAADRIAILSGVWYISESTSTGWSVAGLPFEEGLFFCVTNVLVAQGIMLLTTKPKGIIKTPNPFSHLFGHSKSASGEIA